MMRTGFIGGLLVIGGCLLIVVSAAIAIGGGQVSVEGAGPGSLAVTVAMAMLAVGAVLIGVGGPRPLDGRLARFGLVLSAIGLIASLATATVPSTSLLVVVFVIGVPVACIGLIVTALVLLATPGRPRQAGLVFFAGLLIAIAAGALNGVVGGTIAGPIALLGGGMILLGIGAIGLLGLLGGHSPGTGPG